jgi:iron complex transport system permease protein
MTWTARSPVELSPRFTFGRAAALICGLAFLVVVSFATSARFGEQPISLSIALTDSASTDAAIFWSLRLPRAFLALIVGAALAASGATLQGLMRNPLADPFVLGVSGGAALGATLAIAAGLSTASQLFSRPLHDALARFSAPSLFAFAGSVAATSLALLGGRVQGQSSPYASLLTGVIFNAFAAAAVTSIKALVMPEKLGEILYWLAGTLGYESAWTLALAAALQIVAIGTMWIYAGKLNLLMLGDDDAASLGVSVSAVRRMLLLAASLSVAGAVALSGLIGFVGLIVPHLLRLWLGPDQRLLIPCSALGGAAFLAFSDLLTRMLFSVFHAELPVGVVTALLGGPFFLIVLHRRRLSPGASSWS